jgi:uncharacterized protein YbcI
VVSIPERSRGELLASINRRLVQLHARYYGKGPTRARTYMVGDLVISILGDALTPVESVLVDAGDADTVSDVRRAFRQSMESRFRAVVEEETGRRVEAYVSEILAEADVSVELFFLAD